MTKPTVLHIIHGDAFGGVEFWITKIYAHINAYSYINVLVSGRSIHPALQRFLTTHKICYWHVPIKRSLFNYYHQLSLLRDDFSEISIVHCHIYYKSLLPIVYFKIIGKKIIVHNHSNATKFIKKNHLKVIFWFAKILINLLTDVRLAVSKLAYQDLFNGTCLPKAIIPCGCIIDPILYYQQNIVVNQNMINSTIQILHIGRFYESAFFKTDKNHFFILDILQKLLAKQINFKMTFVGMTSSEAFRLRANDLGLGGHLIFINYVSDKKVLFTETDIFLFPSQHEGYGLSLVEAQLHGCRCLISENIPDEAIITRNVIQLPLTASTSTWAKAIVTLTTKTLSSDYLDTIKHCSLPQNALRLQEYYHDTTRNN